MEAQKQDFDLQQLIIDVYLNYDRLNKRLQQKYPSAFEAFNDFTFSDESYPFSYFEFFYHFDLSFRYKETEAINMNYSGTFSYRIIFDKETAVKLNRSKKDFAYYGINTKEKAVEKLIDKSFEIIDCLLRGKELPEKLRRNT